MLILISATSRSASIAQGCAGSPGHVTWEQNYSVILQRMMSLTLDHLNVGPSTWMWLLKNSYMDQKSESSNPSMDPTVPGIDPAIPGMDPAVPSMDPTVPSMAPYSTRYDTLQYPVYAQALGQMSPPSAQSTYNQCWHALARTNPHSSMQDHLHCKSTQSVPFTTRYHSQSWSSLSQLC